MVTTIEATTVSDYSPMPASPARGKQTQAGLRNE
jgi:hypothetical protein